jgi:hypothetical protein
MLTMNGVEVKPTKLKPTITKPEVAAPVGETTKLVDAIVEQYPLIEAAKPAKKISDDARKELLELVGPTAYANEAIVVHGTDGTVKFGPESEQIECTDIKKVHEFLGDAFYALAKVGITDLRKYLTPHQLGQVTAPCPGSRQMTVLPKQE